MMPSREQPPVAVERVWVPVVLLAQGQVPQASAVGVEDGGLADNFVIRNVLRRNFRQAKLAEVRRDVPEAIAVNVNLRSRGGRRARHGEDPAQPHILVIVERQPLLSVVLVVQGHLQGVTTGEGELGSVALHGPTVQILSNHSLLPKSAPELVGVDEGASKDIDAEVAAKGPTPGVEIMDDRRLVISEESLLAVDVVGHGGRLGEIREATSSVVGNLDVNSSRIVTVTSLLQERRRHANDGGAVEPLDGRGDVKAAILEPSLEPSATESAAQGACLLEIVTEDDDLRETNPRAVIGLQAGDLGHGQVLEDQG
mmetsp:Transcript_26061/g.49209  ORF Transcript_26061/g.49209 Transcript_26061/m.49209 type:complete len:312 (+) Transcript_26061:7913-8848(+)